MSLQFIIGSSGAGKSHTAYEEMIGEAVRHPDRQYLVIVPDQFTMQTQKTITGMHPRRGLLNIDVLSFTRLAWRVFEETGGDDRPVLDDLGKSLVLQRVITEQQKKLKVLGSSLTKQGSVTQMKSLVSELLQYRVRPEDLSDTGSLPPGHSYLQAKLADVQTVYEGFLTYLRERYLTIEEMPELLCSVIQDSRLVRGSTVILDGFTGFTPVQKLVVRQLLLLCRQVTVTVTMDPRAAAARAAGIHQLFHMSGDMIRGLEALAGETHTEILPPRYIDDSVKGRHAGKPALRFLEQNLFRFGKTAYPDASERVTFLEADTPHREVAAAAETILRMVREEGMHYRDFALLSGDLEVYGREAGRVFAEAGIPCFIDRRKPVMTNQAVEFMRAAVDMIVQRYSYESVFRLLRTGLTDFSADETDILENYVLALGIRGRKQYEEVWVRKPRTEKADRLLEYNELRKRFLAMTEGLHAGMHEYRGSARRKAEVIYTFLAENRMQEKCARIAEELQQEGRTDLAREYARIWQTICDLLNRLVEVLGDEQMGLEAFQDVLDAGLGECSIGLVPPGEDQVMVGDIERTRLREIRVLFFAGVNEGVVPRPPDTGGILSDADRECLKQTDLELAPTAREEICRQRFYLYLCLTRPADQLVISWCRTGSDGRAALPSHLAADLRRMFPAVPVRTDREGFDEMSRLETPEGRREVFLSSLQNLEEGRMDEILVPLAAWLSRTAEGAAQTERLLEAAGADGVKEGIGQELAGRLYGQTLLNSVTRLEEFSSCACRHFLDYGLRLREREEYVFTPADFGTVMHSALEHYAGNLRREDLAWTALTDEQRTRLADLSLDEVVHDYNNTILHSTERNRFLMGRIREMMQRTVWALQEQLRRGDFRPAEFEFDFTDDLETMHFRLPGGSMRLRGRIDRIDELEAGGKRYLKIIDYKTGRTGLDLDRLWNGTQLQLAVYVNAALESAARSHPGETAEPAGIFYYHIDDPFLSEIPGTEGDGMSHEELLRLSREEILKKLKPGGLVRSESDILRHLDRTLERGASSVLPVSLNKDGSLSKSSSAENGEAFSLIRSFALRKAAELGTRMMKGETGTLPLLDGEISACTYCPYNGICGFDLKLEGCRYRRMERGGDVIGRIRELLAEDGQKSPDGTDDIRTEQGESGHQTQRSGDEQHSPEKDREKGERG